MEGATGWVGLAQDVADLFEALEGCFSLWDEGGHNLHIHAPEDRSVAVARVRAYRILNREHVRATARVRDALRGFTRSEYMREYCKRWREGRKQLKAVSK